MEAVALGFWTPFYSAVGSSGVGWVSAVPVILRSLASADQAGAQWLPHSVTSC